VRTEPAMAVEFRQGVKGAPRPRRAPNPTRPFAAMFGQGLLKRGGVWYPGSVALCWVPHLRRGRTKAVKTGRIAKQTSPRGLARNPCRRGLAQDSQPVRANGAMAGSGDGLHASRGPSQAGVASFPVRFGA
jgi:hypothetical protein